MSKENTPIIESLLWTDLYKLTMGQMVFHNYPDIYAGYEFINRGKTQFPSDFAQKLRDQISMMATLRLTDQEISGLKKKAPFLKPDFMDFLAGFQFDPSEVRVDQSAGDLSIKINGPWQSAIYWEVPLMTTVSELYYRETNQPPLGDWQERVFEKGRRLRENGVKTVEFGTRRAHSTQVHREVLQNLLAGGGRPEDGGVILGTSNVALALEHDIQVVGTYAHESVQAHAGLFGVSQANEKAMEVWNREYGGKFGIALTDTFTTDVFLRSFNSYWARVFDGVRQDSSDPVEIGERLIKHYLSLGINPQDKKLVFSDGLDTQKAIDLNDHFRSRIQPLFGIGTHFTNDVGRKPLNIVIKLVSITTPSGETRPVVKLSDNPGKISGDPATARAYREELGI